MNFRHALVLAINTAILAVLFVFSSWLYISSRREVESAVLASLTKTQAMTGFLAELRERELQSLAQSLAVSPILRGALATRDKETIQDVLASLAEKNSLDAVAVVRRGVPVHASRAGLASQEELGRGSFLGSSELPGDREDSLVAARAPSAGLLEAWSRITDARYSILPKGGSQPVHDLAPGREALLSKPLPETAAVLSSDGDKFYAREFPLLEGRFLVRIFLPHAPFWSGFETRRNSLVILGGALFLCGLVTSALFAAWIERYARPDSAEGKTAEFLAEIEDVRKRLILLEEKR